MAASSAGRLRCDVTLTFDLLTLKPKQFIFVPRCINDKSLAKIHRYLRYRKNIVSHACTGSVQNIQPPVPAKLHRQRSFVGSGDFKKATDYCSRQTPQHQLLLGVVLHDALLLPASSALVCTDDEVDLHQSRWIWTQIPTDNCTHTQTHAPSTSATWQCSSTENTHNKLLQAHQY